MRKPDRGTQMFNILVAEDDKNTRKLMEAILSREGYHVFAAENGEDALSMMDIQQIDLIILDIMMPGMDGYTFAQTLRDGGFTTPILMVTAKQHPADKKRGFLVGTDDYMVKPIDTEEMLLRIKALLRRAQIVSERKLTLGKIILSYDALTVTRESDMQTLPQKEFFLLYKLLSYPGRVFTRLELMDEIWGMETESTDTTVNVHVNRLRNRFETYPEFEIVAVRGLGYKVVKKV